MAVFPDPLDLFYPSCQSWTKSVLHEPSQEFLGDLVRVVTLVQGPHRIEDIYRLFAVEIPDSPAVRRHLLQEFRQRTFLELLHETGSEYRLDWSRKDHSFCLWYRHRDARRDITRDLAFVRANTLPLFPGTVIRNSTIHGFGLFTLVAHSAGEWLGDPLPGQILTPDQYDLLRVRLSHHLGRLRHFFFTEWNALSGHRLLVRPLRTTYSFINHASQPNLELVTQDPDRLRLRTRQAIPAQTELTLDYRQESLPLNYFENPQACYLLPAECPGIEAVSDLS